MKFTYSWLIEHLNSNITAQKISFDLFKASVMAFIHSIIPSLFQTNASKKIISLHNYLEEKKRIKNEN